MINIKEKISIALFAFEAILESKDADLLLVDVEKEFALYEDANYVAPTMFINV